MATKNIGTLGAKITADTRDFRKNVSDARKSVETMGERTQRSITRMNRALKAATAAAGALVAALAVRQVIRTIDDTFTRVTALADTATKLNITTDALQELRFAAASAGVATNTLETSLRRLTREQDAAIQGNKQSADRFRELGISMQELIMLKPDELMNRVVDALAGVSSGSRQTALAFSLFNAEGVSMLQIARQGEGALQGMREEAHRLGVVMSREMVEGAHAAKNELDKLKMVLGAQLDQTIVQLAPAMQQIASSLIEAIPHLVYLMETHKRSPLRVEIDKQSSATLFRQIQEIQDKLGTLDEMLEHSSGKNTDRIKAAIERQLTDLEELTVAFEGALAREGFQSEAATAALKERQRLAQEELETRERIDALNKRADRRHLDNTRDANRMLDESERILADILKRKEAAVAADKASAAAILDQLDPMRQIKQQHEEILRLKELGYLADNEAEEAIKRLQDSLKDTNKFAQDLGFAFESSFEKAVLGGMKMREVLKGILEDILKIVLRSMITKPLGNAVTAGLGNIFGAGKAGGGRIQPGQLYPVGERGPELIATSSPARVLNRSHSKQMLGQGGQMPVHVTLNNQGTAQEVVSSNASINPRGVVIQVITEDLKRGGPISNGLQSAYGVRRKAK